MSSILRRALLACPLLGCQPNEFRSFVEESEYYVVNWKAALGDAQWSTRVLDYAHSVSMAIAADSLIFPRPGQDSLDAMIDRGRDAKQLSDGRTIVLGGGGFLLGIAPNGVVSVLARRGEGPGELAGPEWVKSLPDGGFVVWDGQLLRMSWFDRKGFSRAYRVELDGGGGRLTYPLTITDDGFALARSRSEYPGRDGVYLHRADVVALDSSGRFYRTILHDAPFAERHLQSVPSSVQGRRGVAMFTPPFARVGDVLAGNTGVCYVWTGSAEFGCQSRLGGPWIVVRDTTPARVIRETDLRVYLDSVNLLGMSAGRRAAQETAVRRIPIADSMPRWGRAFLDSEGIFWLPRFAPIPERMQQVLKVRGDQVLASFWIARGDRIRWASSDRLIVERIDRDGVHTFRLLTLESRS